MLVKGNTAVERGTAIATFDPNGGYGNHTDGSSHAAIYLGQDQSGLIVLDQFTRPAAHPVQQRMIHFDGQRIAANNGNVFFVIV